MRFRYGDVVMLKRPFWPAMMRYLPEGSIAVVISRGGEPDHRRKWSRTADGTVVYTEESGRMICWEHEIEHLMANIDPVNKCASNNARYRYDVGDIIMLNMKSNYRNCLALAGSSGIILYQPDDTEECYWVDFGPDIGPMPVLTKEIDILSKQGEVDGSTGLRNTRSD